MTNDEIIAEQTIDRLKMIRDSLLNEAAIVAAYPMWSTEFAVGQIREVWSNTRKYRAPRPPLTIKQLQTMSVPQLLLFGFNRWSESTNLYLIPLWVVGHIDPNDQVECIDGTVYKLSEADHDVRFGCIAYGFQK